MKQFPLFLMALMALNLSLSAQRKEEKTNTCKSRFNTETLTSVNGKIMEVIQISTQAEMAFGTHILIDHNGDSIVAHIGPSWYLEKMKVRFEKGDYIELSGSQIVFEGEPVIIASSIELKGQTTILRNKKGVPKWSAMCRNKKGGGNCRYSS